MKAQKKDTNRIAKVNSLIKRELGLILHDFQQGQDGLITIVKVDTSKDMKWAKVWISVFGADGDKTLKRINDDIYAIQGELNKFFATKVIPRLTFKLDTGASYAQHIDEVIRKIHEENS